MKAQPLLLVLLSSAVVVAQGPIVAVSWAGTSTLIDPATGIGTSLGASGAVNLNSMARNPATGIIYAVARTGSPSAPAPAAVYAIDPMTGAATSTGVPLTVADVRGLAFTPAGVCYAVVEGIPDALYTVDLATGASTLVGPTGFGSIQALAGNAAGALFAWEINPTGTGGTLLSVNPATGAGTVIGPGTASIQALAFSPSGTLYGCRDALFTVDPATGATTAIGAGGYNDVRGIEFTSSIGTVTFLPANGQVTPGGTLQVRYNAPAQPSVAFVPVCGCGLGSTPIPGLSQPLAIVWDACTDFYFFDAAGVVVMNLSGVPGSFLGTLDATGFAAGTVAPPLGAIPAGLNIPVHVTYVTLGAQGFEVQGVGTFVLN